MLRIVLCILAAWSMQASAAAALAPTSAEYLANRIWSGAGRNSAPARLCEQLSRRVAAKEWGKAIRLTEHLTPYMPHKFESYEKDSPWEWRVAIGELYLYDLRLQPAIQQFETVFKAIPHHRRPGTEGSFAREAASYAMARVLAERGDFRAALRWQMRAPHEFSSGCGTCAERKRMLAHPILVVWTRARLPYERAVPELEAIMNGRFRAMAVDTLPQKLAAESQRRHARAEAALVLGELHLRHGQREKALACFTTAAASQFDLSRIAQTYLRRLRQYDRLVHRMTRIIVDGNYGVRTVSGR
jgi:tetratricopeptide (TPR) repeat protein